MVCWKIVKTNKEARLKLRKVLALDALVEKRSVGRLWEDGLFQPPDPGQANRLCQTDSRQYGAVQQKRSLGA